MLKIEWREAIQIKDEKERVCVQSYTKKQSPKREIFSFYICFNGEEKVA
jgi:hypothetical protein